MAKQHGEGANTAVCAMSVEVAQRYCVLSRDLYSPSELSVLDGLGVMFLSGASERLSWLVQGTEKVSPALRAIAHHLSSRACDALPELCKKLRGLILEWTPREGQSVSAGQGRGSGKPKRKEYVAESLPESVLRHLPVFETLDGRWVSAAGSMGTVQICAAPSNHWESTLRQHAATIPCLSSQGDAARLLAIANLTGKHEEEFIGGCVAPFLLQQAAMGADVHETVCVAFIEAVERCSRLESMWKRKQERNPRTIIAALTEVPLVLCADGVRRLSSEVMDPADPDLRAVYGNNDSAELYPSQAYQSLAALKVLRKAGMSSLGDGNSFVRAAQHIARQLPDDQGHPTAETLSGARQLLSFLVARSASSLQWSNEHYAQVAAAQWAPVQDWSDLTFPPRSCLKLMRNKENSASLSGSSEIEASESADEEEDRLSTQEIRKRITTIYREKNPAKQGDVAKLMKKYKGGKEMSLYRSILRKYKVHEKSFFTDTLPVQQEEEHCPADQVEDQAFADHWRLVSLSEGTLHQSAVLGWTQLLILDKAADGLGAALASRLRFHNVPPPSLVATHLKKVVQVMRRLDLSDEATAWRCRAVIQQCCLALARAVKKGSRTTGAALIAELGECRFILTASEGGLPAFVKARHLCFDLEGGVDLGPEARAVPLYLEGSRDLFTLLGSPSAFDRPKGAPTVHVSAPPPSFGMQKFVKAQFNKPELSDVHFELADGSVIYAHRLVLADVCEYFQNLFIGEMALTALPCTIAMPEWAGRRSAILLFSNIYNGGALNVSGEFGGGFMLGKSDPESFEIVLNLLRLADMYGMSYAKEWSEEWLASSNVLDIWNVCNMLTNAHTCNADQLTGLCVHHIQKAYKLVERTQEWAELTDDLKQLVFGRGQGVGDSSHAEGAEREW
jgi:hypothetical protein